jgi:hypothetical protein
MYYYDKSRRMRWAERVACLGDIRNAYRILVRIPERKRPLLEENIKMDRS